MTPISSGTRQCEKVLPTHPGVEGAGWTGGLWLLGVVAAPRKHREGLPPDVADLDSRRRQARLNGYKPLYRSLKKAASKALRGAEEARVREVFDRVTTHLFISNSGPAFREILYFGWEEAHP